MRNPDMGTLCQGCKHRFGAHTASSGVAGKCWADKENGAGFDCDCTVFSEFLPVDLEPIRERLMKLVS